MSQGDGKQIQNYGADYAGEVLKQIVATVGAAPDATLQEIQARMNTLYDQHSAMGDTNGLAIIEQAWGQITQIHQTAGAAIDLAAAARQVAQTMEEQRDMALKQHEALTSDVANANINNPLIDALVDEVRDGVHEDMANSGYYFTYCPPCDITEEAAIPITHDQAEIFFQMLISTEISENFEDEVADALRAELATFITNFVHKYHRMTNGDMD